VGRRLAASFLRLALIALWRCQAAEFRVSFALLTFIGVQTLGAQPEAWCVSDDLFSSEVLAIP
jgi:hypothetical protein